MSPAEKGYAQLDKEALAIVFGVTKFHVYLYGHSFTIYSDHKPLQAILAMASARIQHWALLLSSYQYTVIYKPGSQMVNADVLSRLPLPETPESVPIPGEIVLLMQNLENSPVTFNHLRQWTTKDPTLSKVHRLLLQGWQYSNDPDLKPYQVRHSELSVCDGCVMWGNRLVPQAGRKKVMEQLHDGYPGISRMKSLARSFVWWPQMDDEIADRVKYSLMFLEISPNDAHFHSL